MGFWDDEESQPWEPSPVVAPPNVPGAGTPRVGPPKIKAPSRWNRDYQDEIGGDVPDYGEGAYRNDELDIDPNPRPAEAPPEEAAAAGDEEEAQGGSAKNHLPPRKMKMYQTPSAPSTSGGGGSGAPKTSSTTAPNPNAVPDFGGENQKIIDALNGMIDGTGDNPWGEKWISGQKDRLFESMQGRKAAAGDALQNDAIRRGVLRSGITGDAQANLERTAMGQYSQGVREIGFEAAQKTYDMKVGALDRAQKWLDSQRDYLLQHEQNEVARSTGIAQVNLGYARIAAEKEMLDKQLAARGGGGGGGNSSAADALQLFNLFQ